MEKPPRSETRLGDAECFDTIQLHGDEGRPQGLEAYAGKQCIQNDETYQRYSKLDYSTKRISQSVSPNRIADAQEDKEVVQVNKASGRTDPRIFHKTGWRANRWLLPQDLKATKRHIEKKRKPRAANKTATRQDFDIPLITENHEEQNHNVGDSLNFAHRTQLP